MARKEYMTLENNHRNLMKQRCSGGFAIRVKKDQVFNLEKSLRRCAASIFSMRIPDPHRTQLILQSSFCDRQFVCPLCRILLSSTPAGSFTLGLNAHWGDQACHLKQLIVRFAGDANDRIRRNWHPFSLQQLLQTRFWILCYSRRVESAHNRFEQCCDYLGCRFKTGIDDKRRR